MTVHAGDTGVDFSFAKPPASRLIELGHRFVVGYISDLPASPAKNISKEQCDEYTAAGLELLLVWEMTATRASLGAAFGAADGRRAAILAAERGYPTYKPIIAADDTNTTASNLDAQEAYMRAFAEACAPYPNIIGIYGDVDVLERCAGLWQIGWVPNAWAWSGVSRADAEARALAVGAHVLQHKGFYIDNTWAVDPNVVIRDLPAWGETDPTPISVPVSAFEEDDMFHGFVQDQQGHFWARGVEYVNGAWRQWACLIQELGIDWNLYGVELKVVPTASLEGCHRVPAAPVVIVTNTITNTVPAAPLAAHGTWTVA